MSYTPTETTQPQTPQKDNKKIIYALLVGALILTWGYIIYDKNKTKEIITQK
jgi:hypothetical protein